MPNPESYRKGIRLMKQAEKFHRPIDPSRIPAQLLSGIGFIGAGTILRDGFNVKGLTTAAGLLAVTCIGLSIGAGYRLYRNNWTI